MDQQYIINIIIGVSITVAGWFLKSVLASIKELNDEDKKLQATLANIQLLIAGDYVKRTELDRMSNILFEKLDRIESKVDNKIDRRWHPDDKN